MNLHLLRKRVSQQAAVKSGAMRGLRSDHTGIVVEPRYARHTVYRTAAQFVAKRQADGVDVVKVPKEPCSARSRTLSVGVRATC
jgi:hypothetical protein